MKSNNEDPALNIKRQTVEIHPTQNNGAPVVQRGRRMTVKRANEGWECTASEYQGRLAEMITILSAYLHEYGDIYCMIGINQLEKISQVDVVKCNDGEKVVLINP